MIAPFPLRDNQLNSPFVRHTYKENSDSNHSDSDDFYWISYEILLMSSFSGYGTTSNSTTQCNWMKNWGKMEPGEFTRCTGMECWN